MKKNLLLILLFTTASSLFANELAAMWTRLYNRLDTLDYKLSIMQNIVEEDSRELVDIIVTSLAETNAMRSSIIDANEKRIYDTLQRISIRKLGDFKAIEAEDEIYEAYSNSDSLTVTTEAVIALGRIGSVKYVEELSLALRNINMRLSGNRDMRANEAMAYAIVSAFENLRAAETYEPVFYASAGWYSPISGVREKAVKALKVISEDPTEILTAIMRKEPDFGKKYLALQAQNESRATDEKKASAAVEGLRQGIVNKTSDINENARLSEIRVLSCRMISASAYKPVEAVPYLGEMLFTDYDINEKLTAIETLGTYSDAEAVAALSSFLRQQNDRQAAGMTQMIDRRAVIATINALAATGNPAAMEEIHIVSTIDWPSAVLRAAKAAAEKLNRQ